MSTACLSLRRDLARNNFTSPLPNELSRLSSLGYLSISGTGILLPWPMGMMSSRLGSCWYGFVILSHLSRQSDVLRPVQTVLHQLDRVRHKPEQCELLQQLRSHMYNTNLCHKHPA